MLEEVRRVILKYRTKKSFMYRVEMCFGCNSTEYLLIKSAYELARREFRGVTRHSGEPYFYHKLAVAVILMEYLFIHDDASLVAAALLHDLLEDVEGWTSTRLALELNDDVATLVFAVTKPDERKYLTTHEFEKAIFTKVRLIGGIRGIKLKLADRLHNMITLWGSPEKCVKKTHETIRYILPLADEVNVLWRELTVACAEELIQHKELFK
jgi:GTP diphosphokinase / guanosine-3',5'-bis(diphosphate) 3'-diphosphatase